MPPTFAVPYTSPERTSGRSARDAEQGQKFVVPIERVNIEEHGAGGVGAVGDVHFPPVSFHTSQVSTVPNSSSPLRALPRPLHVVENPFDLARGKIGVGDQPVFLIISDAPPFHFDDGRRPTALPDDRVTDGFARLPIPYNVVSLWLVMPMAAMSSGSMPLRATTSIITPYWLDQMSMGSCSTHPPG